MTANPVPPQLTPFTAETARKQANKRWAANLEERVNKRVDELVRMAPPLTASQRAKLTALLSRVA